MKLKTPPEKRLENGMHPASQSLFLKLECVFGNFCINHVCLKSGGLSYVTLSVDISVMKRSKTLLSGSPFDGCFLDMSKNVKALTTENYIPCEI